MQAREIDHRGWTVVRLMEGPLEVDVVPGKGGDILAVRYSGTNVLWESPNGLRPRAESPRGVTSWERWLEMYPGGWQTIFPNGGAESEGIGFHGIAALVPHEHEVTGDALVLRTTIDEFDLVRRVRVGDRTVSVDETITHNGTTARDVMWSHHPAFGAPLFAGTARLDCGATAFVTDDGEPIRETDLLPGGEAAWPHARRRDGSLVDLRALPSQEEPLYRMGYLTGFSDGWASITNDDIGLAVRLEWDASVFPAAWMWLDAHATTEYPWSGRIYVLAIEPASTWPGQGLAAARTKGNGPLRFEPGESKTARVSLTVRAT